MLLFRSNLQRADKLIDHIFLTHVLLMFNNANVFRALAAAIMTSFSTLIRSEYSGSLSDIAKFIAVKSFLTSYDYFPFANKKEGNVFQIFRCKGIVTETIMCPSAELFIANLRWYLSQIILVRCRPSPLP